MTPWKRAAPQSAKRPDGGAAAADRPCPEGIARVCQHSGGGGCRAVTSREALAKLPVTRKHELLERQQAGRATNVFGGFSALGFGPGMTRVFASPGPIYEPEGTRPDYWRMARAIHAAGFRRAS
jgi:hypothetical protein